MAFRTAVSNIAKKTALAAAPKVRLDIEWLFLTFVVSEWTENRLEHGT